MNEGLHFSIDGTSDADLRAWKQAPCRANPSHCGILFPLTRAFGADLEIGVPRGWSAEVETLFRNRA